MEFFIPFPARSNKEDPEAVTRRNVAWLTGYGLLQPGETTERYLDMGVAEFAMKLYSAATGPRLDMALDTLAWGFYVNDQINGDMGQDPQRLVGTLRKLIAITSRPPGACASDTHPLVVAWADVWARQCEGMSQAWRRRAAGHWRLWFSSALALAADRARGQAQPLHAHLQVRRAWIGAGAYTNLIESACGFEAPQELWDSVQWQGIQEACADCLCLLNDVYSLEVDELTGQLHNTVALLQREQGVSRNEAVQETVRMARAAIDRWQRLQEDLPTVYEAFSISTERRRAAELFLDGIGAVVRANYDWYRKSGRYDPDFHRDGPAYARTLPSMDDMSSRT
ncbi:terpene synthase family protein [Streptomyces gilvosporeus]|uniref:terpene synthase family protein n=1 Tax=Streptomyces gilvosporeus TaxID=553510 RepID=UPI00131B1253|nr:hypothetical protein [Streptomyces gilvosporeus]